MKMLSPRVSQVFVNADEPSDEASAKLRWWQLHIDASVLLLLSHQATNKLRVLRLKSATTTKTVRR
jgi:hypothetical protein